MILTLHCLLCECRQRRHCWSNHSCRWWPSRNFTPSWRADSPPLPVNICPAFCIHIASHEGDVFVMIIAVWYVGSVLAAYISFGISASNLISASVMAAPAALAFSKLFYPETEKSKTTAKNIRMEKGYLATTKKTARFFKRLCLAANLNYPSIAQ